MNNKVVSTNAIEFDDEAVSVNYNNNPKTLYKYTSLNYLESCILDGVYAAPIEDVNDPFECDGITYPNLYRICCLTSSSRHMLLWAYYANHKECCVEFDVSNIDPNILRKVDYVESFTSHSDMSMDEVYMSLYRKGKEWQHEKEYRAVYYKNDRNSIWRINGNNVFLKVPVKSVMFGLFADRDLVRYKLALDTLKRYNIEGRRCKLRNNKYEIEDNRQFNVDAELERVNRIINQGKQNEEILRQVARNLAMYGLRLEIS